MLRENIGKITFTLSSPDDSKSNEEKKVVNSLLLS